MTSRILRLTVVVLFLHAMMGCLPLAQAEEPSEVEVTGALPVELLGTTESAPNLAFTTAGGTKVSISCEKLALEKALLQETGKGTGTGLFTGCITKLNGVTSAPCKPKAGGASLGTIKTLALKAVLVAHEGASVVKIEAQSGKLFVKIEIGEMCAIGEFVNVEAKSAGEGLWLKEKNGQLETLKVAHGFEEGPLAGLIALGQPATLTGGESISLAGAHASREWRGVASKPAWFVTTPVPSEVEVTGALPVELLGTTESAPNLAFTTAGGTKVSISCEKLALEKALLQETGKGTGTGLFTGCITKLNGVTSAPCKPKAGGASLGTIKTLALKAVLVAHEGASVVKIEAQSGKLFVKIEIGEECAIGEFVNVEAKSAGEGLWLKEKNGQLETLKVAHGFEEGPLAGLIALGQPATLTGGESISLAGAHASREWRGVASKPAWFVTTPVPSEVEVTGALPVELLGTTESAPNLAFTTAGGTKVSISCEKLALEKALLQETGKGTGTGLFTGCITKLNGVTSAPCKPKAGGASLGTIKTLALKAVLVAHEGASVVKIEAQSGKLFVKIEIGEMCAIGEFVNVEAKSAGEGLWLKEKNGQLETLKVAHGFEEGPLAGLIALGQPATLTGGESISLAGAHASREWRGVASKPAWFVTTPVPSEVEVTGALPVELLGTTESAPNLAFTTAGGTKVSISCEKLALEKALLQETGKGTGTGLFTGCITKLNGVTSAPCKPKAGGASLGTIKTLALKAVLVAHEGASVVKIEAQSGKLFVKIEIGEECAIGEFVNVEAKSAGEGLWLKEKNGQLETLKVAHGFEEGPLAGLIALGQPATLTGGESISLAGAHASREWRGVASKPAWFVGTA